MVKVIIRLIFAVYALTSTFASNCEASDDRLDQRPNVILILADDLAVGDLHGDPSRGAETPNLDRLAEQSVRFTQAYSASCVCAPARAALLTGRYPHRTGVVTLNMQKFPVITRLRKDETTIADVFGDPGYATGLVGKWHVGRGEAYHPLSRGFDEFEGFDGSQVLSYFDYSLDVGGKNVPVDDDYLTNDLSRRAIEFVRRHRDEPFFLHLAHYAPHRPLEAPASVIEKYSRRGFDRSTATIYAMIEVMDRGIGELMNELDALDLSKNTIVVFASDNGPDPLATQSPKPAPKSVPALKSEPSPKSVPRLDSSTNPKTKNRANGDLRGTKYQVYEGGIRVPLFVRWSESLESGDRDQPVNFVDLMPRLSNSARFNGRRRTRWMATAFRRS